MKSWIAPKDPSKNKNILMLDLEQVLFVDANLLLNREDFKIKDNNFYEECCQLRNYSKEFVFEIKNIFDEVYLNTYVNEEKANIIMKDFFNSEFSYYWGLPGLKSGGYEKFPKNIQLFHLEDEILGKFLKKDSDNMKRLNVNIFDVAPYNKYEKNDNELEKILINMKKIIL